MEEILDHVRKDTCYVLFCSSIGKYVFGYAEDVVTFNAFQAKELKTLEEAIAAKKTCKSTIRNNSKPGERPTYRLSIVKREYTWTPGGNTQLTETTITL